MKIEFDPEKTATNVAKHGIGLNRAQDIDLNEAIIVENTQRSHGERRWQAYGYIEDRLYVLCFTWRGSSLRAISLRKCNKRERMKYAQTS